MHELDVAKQELRKAESLVAQYQGERRALETQQTALAGQLAALGINPDKAEETLAALDAEVAKVEAELADATRELNAALTT